MNQEHSRGAYGARGSHKPFSQRKSSGGSRFSSGSGRSFGSARSAGRGGSYGGNRGGGRNFGQYIDSAKFIRKAKPAEAIVEFVPKHTFADFLIDPRLKNNIIKKGYIKPTPIQDQSIPVVLQGKDIVGIANTGTGKTAAFLVPLIDKVLKFPKEKILIVVPTRELAQQIESELKGFAFGLGVWGICAVGGVNITGQIRAMARPFNFLIGTPGRLRDLIDRRRINLTEYTTVVLDEADRMLDMGFVNEIRFMVSQMPKTRQTLFFSATMSAEVNALVKDFLTNPISISVKTGNTADQVDQDVVRVPPGKDKTEVLCDLLASQGFDKVLIFGRTKHGVQRLADSLSKKGFKADAIHGNKSQGQRQRALQLFKEDHVKVLVATDVAARGLDIVDVSHVINFDVPATYEDYVHRIGRTGRAGKKGTAFTFV